MQINCGILCFESQIAKQNDNMKLCHSLNQQQKTVWLVKSLFELILL